MEIFCLYVIKCAFISFVLPEINHLAGDPIPEPVMFGITVALSLGLLYQYTAGMAAASAIALQADATQYNYRYMVDPAGGLHLLRAEIHPTAETAALY